MVDRHKGRVNYLNAAWLCCFKLKFTLSFGPARRLEQKPRPALGFVDPHFNQARSGDITMLVTDVVRLAQTRCHRFVVQTGVKSFGCEKRTAQESPIHSVEANTSMRCFRLTVGTFSPILRGFVLKVFALNRSFSNTERNG